MDPRSLVQKTSRASGGLRDGGGGGGDDEGAVAGGVHDGGPGRRLRPVAAAEPPPADQRGAAALLRRPLARRPVPLRHGRAQRRLHGQLRQHVLPRRRSPVAQRHPGLLRAPLLRAPPARLRGLGGPPPLACLLPRPAPRHHRRRRPLRRRGPQLRPGVREGFRAERAGVPDERGAGHREELPAEDAAAAGVGEADRPVQARGGRDAGELQGAQGPQARRGHAGGELRRERHRPRGAGRLRVLVDHPAPRLHQVHRRPHPRRDARVPERDPSHHEPVPRRRVRHLPHPPLRRRLLHDRPQDGRVRVPDRDPSPVLHGAAVRAGAAQARGGREQGHGGADRDAAARAELPHAGLLLARPPAAQRHLPLQDGGVLPHGRQQVQRHPGVHPGLALRLHALQGRLLRRQRQPRQDGLPLVRARELRRHPRLPRHARPGRRHHGPHRGALGGPRRRDAAQDLLPRHRGPRVAVRHRMRPQEHQMELPQWRLLASAPVAPDRGLHQDRAAEDREAGDRPGGGEAGQGQLAGVLRRQARALRGEAGEEAPDVVHRGVPGGQDDAGGPVPPGHDLPRGGQSHESRAQAVSILDGVTRYLINAGGRYVAMFGVGA